MAINAGKLLPSSKSSSLVSKETSKKISTSSNYSFRTDSQVLNPKKTRPSQILIIRKQIIKIENLIKRKYVEDVKKQKEEDKLEEQSRRKKREEKLEDKPKSDEKLPNIPSLPKLGFLDGIKKFIVNMILGFIAFRLIEHLPKIANFLKILAPAVDFFIDFSGKLLDGLVTFIDWGYKAYDFTRKQLKSFGGENFVKIFDTFNGAVSKVIEAAITTAIVLGSQGKDGVLDVGMDIIKDRILQKGAEQAATSAASQAGGAAQAGGIGAGAAAGIVAGAGLLASALGEGAFQLRKFAIKPIQNLENEYKKDKNPFTKIGRGIILNMVKPLFGIFQTAGFLLDVVGAPFRYAIELIRYPFLNENDKKTQATNLAKFDARIREDLRRAFNMLTLGLAFKEKGSFGNIYGNQDAQKGMMSKMAGGGITRGGKLQGSIKRDIKKPTIKRSITIQPTEISPGKDVGGSQEIGKVFPESTRPDTVNPLGYIETTYDLTSKIPFFGPLFGIVSKLMVGEKPSNVDYINIGSGLNSWLNTTFNTETMRTGGGFAGGGEVNSEMFMNGEDLTNIIAKSVEESVSKRADDVIKNLQMQLSLKEIDRGKEPGEEPGAEGEPTGSPTLTGNTNAEKVFRYLVDKEGFTPEAAAGVIGNLMQESGVNPKSRQLGGGPGRGIMQWTETERWASLSAWAKNSGKDPWALETQVEWMIKEMKDYGTYNRIKGVTSYKKAVEIFEREMERAGVPNYPRRYQFAADALASFSGGAGGPGIALGKGYGSEGSKIAGELGRFIKSRLNSPQQFQAVTEHPEHGGVRGTHASGSYHYSGRAVDIGAYTREQGPILNVIAEFNRMKGVKPVELITGRTDPAGHGDHVHVAYSKGGLINGVTYAMLGERGREFVFDNDTTETIRAALPGFLESLNSASNVSNVLRVIQAYTSYDSASSQEIIIDDDQPMGYQSQRMGNQALIIQSSDSGGGSDPFEILDRLPG